MCQHISLDPTFSIHLHWYYCEGHLKNLIASVSLIFMDSAIFSIHVRTFTYVNIVLYHTTAALCKYQTLIDFIWILCTWKQNFIVKYILCYIFTPLVHLSYLFDR